MIDKVGIKIRPKQAISIQIDDTLPDILPLLQRGLIGDKTPNNRPETIRKIRLAHARIYDRILERCAPVRFSGRNYRTENAENTKKAIREIFTQEDSL